VYLHLFVFKKGTQTTQIERIFTDKKNKKSVFIRPIRLIRVPKIFVGTQQVSYRDYRD